MKRLLACVFFSLLIEGCETRAYYPNGGLALATRGDSENLHFKGGGMEMSADRLNHSTPTKAAANATVSGITALGAAAAGLR